MADALVCALAPILIQHHHGILIPNLVRLAPSARRRRVNGVQPVYESLLQYYL